LAQKEGGLSRFSAHFGVRNLLAARREKVIAKQNEHETEGDTPL
jgi:hypothetical protein